MPFLPPNPQYQRTEGMLSSVTVADIDQYLPLAPGL